MNQIEPECLCAEGGGDHVLALQDTGRNRWCIEGQESIQHSPVRLPLLDCTKPVWREGDLKQSAKGQWKRRA